jgi:hypothetical protein
LGLVQQLLNEASCAKPKSVNTKVPAAVVLPPPEPAVVPPERVLVPPPPPAVYPASHPLYKPPPPWHRPKAEEAKPKRNKLENPSGGRHRCWEKALREAQKISPEAARLFCRTYKRPISREEDEAFEKRYRQR